MSDQARIITSKNFGTLDQSHRNLSNRESDQGTDQGSTGRSDSVRDFQNLVGLVREFQILLAQARPEILNFFKPGPTRLSPWIPDKGQLYLYKVKSGWSFWITVEYSWIQLLNI